MIPNSYTSKYVDGLPFVPVTFPFNRPDGIFIEDLKLDDIVKYIAEKRITKAFINGVDNFEFLTRCQDLQHIAVEFCLPFAKIKNLSKKGSKFVKEYDLTPLYELKCLKSLDIRENEIPIVTAKCNIDISQFDHLLSICGNHCFIKGLENATYLRSLYINSYKPKCNNFTDLSKLKDLDTLHLTFSSIKDFEGINNFSKLTCLYLYYNRSLVDISALRSVKNTLKALRIENCAKIDDFSVLGELENLELLELTGSNELPDLSFLKTMPNLKTFTFSMNVLDGDLSLCKNLSYVFSEKDRKHYNVKDKELPRREYVRGNEAIEEWRRLE